MTTAPFAWAFNGFLSAQSGITALVGTRIYPDVLPQDPIYPAITFALAGGYGEHDLAGATDPDRLRMSVHCWGETRASADAVAAAVRAALDGYRGPMTTDESPARTRTVLHTRWEPMPDAFDSDPTPGAERTVRRSIADYIVTVRRN